MQRGVLQKQVGGLENQGGAGIFRGVGWLGKDFVWFLVCFFLGTCGSCGCLSFAFLLTRSPVKNTLPPCKILQAGAAHGWVARLDRLPKRGRGRAARKGFFERL